MKKGLLIALLIVGILLLGVMVANLVNGGIWIIEGLNGKDGKNGQDGADGVNGTDGLNGKSAYELAVEDGFDGSLHEWLLSLAVRGTDGQDGAPGKDGVPGATGATGAAGVGVADVRVDANGHLIVVLTDGTELDAGVISGAFSDEPDEMGFYEVYELVTMNGGPNGYSTLTLRDYPATGEAVSYAAIGETVLRIGIQQTEDGYSRFLVNGEICYAKSNCFELKYDYTATIPMYNLPQRLVLIKDQETWISTDQIMPNKPADTVLSYRFSDKSSYTLQNEKGFSVTPAEVGEATLTVRISKQQDGAWTTVAVEEIPVTVVEQQTELALTGLFIGDSRISGGPFVDEVAAAMPNLTLIGNRGKGDIRHEGRGAWSTDEYMNDHFSDVSTQMVENHFFNPEAGTFDFTYYMENYAQEHDFDPQTLDFVVIHLGANDGWSRESVDNINKMIASIHAYAEDITVFVMTEYLSPADGYYLKGGPNVESMRQRQFAYFTYQTEVFGGREDENIYLLPNYISINDLRDWPTDSFTVDGQQMLLVNDVVHLSNKGYAKEAATVEAWLYWLFGTQQ